MKHRITILAFFAASIAALFGFGQSESKQILLPLTSGWGGIGCRQLPINGGFNCAVVPTGILCTVTEGNTTTYVYDTKSHCEAQTVVGLLKRP